MARKACFLVLLLVVSVAVAMANFIDDAKAKFDNPEKSQEEASTWANWAKDKMSGLNFFDDSKAGQSKEAADRVMGKAGEMVGDANNARPGN